MDDCAISVLCQTKSKDQAVCKSASLRDERPDPLMLESHAIVVFVVCCFWHIYYYYFSSYYFRAIYFNFYYLLLFFWVTTADTYLGRNFRTLSTPRLGTCRYF